MSARQSSYERWGVGEVCFWLRTSGLADLTEQFNAHSITGTDLVRMDDAFLCSRLGITSAQNRTTVLSAIDNLTGRPSSNRSPPKESSLPAPPPMRRGVTVPTGVGTSRPDEQGSMHMANLQAAPRRSSTQHSSVNSAGYPVHKISAQELLHSGAKYGGWIRKQGGSVRTWKRRYMILWRGCVYYFKNEFASSAQGQFSLKDYQAIIATETNKYPWCIKLVNKDKTKRTYFISSSSEIEMNTWQERFEENIRSFWTVTEQDMPPPVVPRPASTLPGHAHARSAPQRQSGNTLPPMMRGFDEFDHDESDEEEAPSLPPPMPARPGGRSNNFRTTLPPRLPPDTGGSGSFGSRKGDPPPLPEREVPVQAAGAGIGDADADYLQLVDGANPGAPLVPPRPQSPPSSVPQPTSFQPVNLANVGSVLPGPPARNKPRMNYEITSLNPKPHNGQSGDQQAETDSSDDDYISPEAYTGELDFDPENMGREEAESLLRDYGHNGSYILRSGSTTQLSVLTVKTGDRCRHYKVFLDTDRQFSLHRGQYFANVADLLEYYHRNVLPKCDFQLSERFIKRW